MPRKHRRKDDDRKELGSTASNRTVEVHDGEDYVVQRTTGSSSTKVYRCPGCDQEIRPATPHVVAWPLADDDRGDSGPQNHRHWHSPCWKARGNRAPNQSRSSRGPRY